MDNQTVINIVSSSVEFWQSLSFALFLLLVNWKKNKKLALLILFLFAISAGALTDVINLWSNQNRNFNLTLLSSNLSVLSVIFLYLYINSLFITSHKKLNQYITLLFSAGILATIPLFFNQNKYWLEIYRNISSLLIFILFVWVIFQIIRHNRKVKEQYSNTNNRELKWILYLTLYSAIGVIVFPLLSVYLNLSDFADFIFLSLFVSVFLLGITYNSLYYKISVDLFDVPKNKKETEKQSNEIEKSSKNIVAEDTSKIFAQIKNVIAEKQLFLNTALTVADLAKEIDKHPKSVSQIINANANNNFNTFINAFRVEHAKTLLQNPKYKHINIDEIGKMAGFRSKTVFYSNFKKVLNITPLQFQKQINQD